MGCVNIASKEFKSLAERNNVDINTLELITHQYWMERGSEDLFPSDIYIQMLLGKIPYQEKFANVRNLWEQQYKAPKEYNNFEDAQRAQEEAMNYFPPYATSIHTTGDGKYIMAVRKPVEKLDYDNIVPQKRLTKDKQYYQDYDLITDKLIEELKENDNFAAAEELSKQKKEKVISHELEDTIQSGNWNTRKVEEFNNIITGVKDGKIQFQRAVGERRPITESISEIHAGASILLRASYGTSKAKPGKALSEFRREAKQGKEQEKIIEAWAKAADLWLNDYADENGNKANTLEDLLNSQWPYFAQGSEAVVHLYDENTVLKAINLSHTNDNVAKLLDKIALFNRQFPESAMNVVGFGRDAMGHFRVIVLQDFIQGNELTEEELKDFTKKYKATPEGNLKTQNEDAIISDLGTYNILKDINGVYHVIDADVVYNTPAVGGDVTFDNTLSYTDMEGQDDNIFPEGIQFSIEGRQTPTTFTFKDGTTVNAPFKLNSEQEDALNAMAEFIKSDEPSMTLSGYAGTGKTSLMEMLAQKMRKNHRPILFSASTNKAAAVLKSRVSKAGFNAYTLNRVFGINVEVDKEKSYDARNLVTALREGIINRGDVVIIDEASMINEENYKILQAKARENNLKIIFVGDEAQLAPVKENKISIVFRNGDGRVVRLTKVERTGDNAILEEATNLRNGKSLSKKSKFNKEGRGVAYVHNSNKKSIAEVVKHYVANLQNNPDYFKILAYTNAAVAKYNSAVRNLLGYTDEIPREGEPMIGYTNWGRVWSRNTGTRYRLVNSEAYKVSRVGAPRTIVAYINGNTEKISLHSIPITLVDSFGNSDTFDYIDIKGDKENREAAQILAHEKARLFNEARGLKGEAAKMMYEQINYIERFLFVNDDIKDGKKSLQNKVIDFGYAMTVHKSQGSTFNNVLMDDVDISTANRGNSFTPVGLEDLSLEDSQDPRDAELLSTEDLDLGLGDDFFDGSISASSADQMFSQPTAQDTDNTADIRQQLRYVAMSRATDTVTVITNDVETEDSPLNHLNSGTESQVFTQKEQLLHPEKKPFVQPAKQETPKLTDEEVWASVAKLEVPKGRREVQYTAPGQTKAQTYHIEGSHIYNSKGKEVYSEDGRHRNVIYSNLAVKEGRAVEVTNSKGRKFIVGSRKQILSLTSGKMMDWKEGDGNRREVLHLAAEAFKQKQSTQKKPKQQSLPGPETKINIYAGAGDNVDLSNFAERPFTLQVIIYNSDGTQDVGPVEFKSVEQAFQYAKLAYSRMDRIQKAKVAQRILNAKTGAEAKNYGGKFWIKSLDEEDWNDSSSEEMKAVLKKSFLQNPEAIKRLLATGNATLTHLSEVQKKMSPEQLAKAKEKDKWIEEFPKLLTEVREELKRERPDFSVGQQQAQQQAPQQAQPSTQTSAASTKRKVSISTRGYRKGDPQKNPDTAYVFTENAQAASKLYKDSLGYDVQVDSENTKVRLAVGDVNGTNQAGIRMDSKGNKSDNAFGLVVKKKQQDSNGKWLAKEGQFEDTAEDFEIFKKFNERFFEQLDNSGLKKIVFPSQVSLGKAALPLKFAKWLQAELKRRYGVNTTLKRNTTAGYEGYGFTVDSIGNQAQSQPQSDTKSTPQLEKTLEDLRTWWHFSNYHLSFDPKTHTYYVDGQKANTSVTQYIESVYGKPNIEGDYSHSSAIGKTADSIYRDYFDRTKDVLTTKYPNLNETRKQQILKDLHRLKQYLDKRFGGTYKVITPEFPIAASIDTAEGVKTIAGTTDMIVIDGNGDIHIFDFKAKRNPIDYKWYNKKTKTWNISDDRRNYTAQQNLYRAILEANPAFKGKVKSLQLIWLDTAYPSLENTTYNTDEQGNVTVSDTKVKDLPLAEYDKFSTPALKENIEDSIIQLDISNTINELTIPELLPIDYNTRIVVEHLKPQVPHVYFRKDIIKYIENLKKQGKNVSILQRAFELNKEMAEIKVKAQADGTFMLAPNGKPTNLNERQWLQTRTKPFRRWFGDWLTYQRIQNAKVIWGHPGTGKTWLFKQGRKDIIDFDSEYKAKLGDFREREVLKKEIGKEAYNQKLDELFEEARQEAIKSGRKLLVSDLHFLRDRADDLDLITNISNEEFIERSHQRGEHDEADKMEWKNSINAALQNISSDKVIETSGYISDLMDGANVSKVVDENGEPLVVYHSNFMPKEEGKSQFIDNIPEVQDFGIARTFFTTKDYLKYSQQFGNNTQAYFLNIRNLYEYHHKDNPKYFHRGEWGTGNIEMGELQSDGYDGALAYRGRRDEYVVATSNQIKSATDNVGTFSTESDNIRMAIEKSENKHVEWVKQNREQLVDQYLKTKGNIFDPDEVRNLLTPIGYNQSNVVEYYDATWILQNYILDKMFDNLAKSDNKTISILSGVSGSGKNFATQNRKEEFSKRGLVLNAPYNHISSLQEVIDRARRAGVADKDIQVVAVHSDAETAYRNIINRAKQIGRFPELEYFLSSFRKNRGKISELRYTNPDVNIVTIDNSRNQNRECSIDEAASWNYEINNEIIKNLVNLVENDNEISESTKERVLEGYRPSSEEDLGEGAGKRQTLGGRTKQEIRLLGERMGLNLPEEDAQKLNEMLEAVGTFLDNFDIKLKDVEDYEGELPLFDALERVINIRTVDDISEGVGEAIAFMMQWHPSFRAIVDLKKLDASATALKGIRRSLRKRGNFDLKETNERDYKKLNRNIPVKAIGKDIARELRRFYNLEEVKEKSSFLEKLWDVIIDFFNKFTPKTRDKFREALYFSSDAAFAVASNNDKFVRYTNLKPGSEPEGATERVDIGKALREFPYEESIVSKMSAEGVGLAGGASIAAFGVLMRPPGNPLHDLDFNAANVCETAEDVKALMDRNFPINAKTNEITNKGGQTETYLILDRPFILERVKKPEDNIFIQSESKTETHIKDEKTGEILGAYIDSELALKDGVQGKFLDFFIGEDSKENIITKNFNGKNYKIADYKRAMRAKVDWTRAKDVFDYNNFKLYNSELQYYMTEDGQIYGFVTPEGDVYLDETVIDSSHPLHEYTHIWDKVVAEKNPELWKAGIELMKKTSLWKEIEDDVNYGGKWKALKRNNTEKYESLIASEVHARLVGEEGKRILDEIADKQGRKGLIEKLKGWLLDFWRAIGGNLNDTFGTWTKQELADLTLEQFEHLTLRDFAESRDLEEAPYAPESTDADLFEDTTQEEGTRVSLPSYEYFNDLYEDTLVDAEWKIPLLQELDKKLSTDNPNNEEILDQMDRILKASSEEEIQSAVPQKVQEEVDEDLDDFDIINIQINKLNHSILTNTEVRHFAELMMNNVSDEITKLQTNKNALKEDFPHFETELDFTKVSRKKIVETLGIDNLLDWAREQMNTEEHEFANLAIDQLADEIYDNWIGIVSFGLDYFAMNEGFGIKRDHKNQKYILKESHRFYAEDYSRHNDIDSVREIEGDEQEHWQIESRTIDVLNSATELVRMAIHNCIEINRDGTVKESIFGIPERKDPKKAIQSILRWTQGAQTLEDMVAALREKSKTHKWLEQLVDRLSKKDGTESDLQSQFFTVMCKTYQKYSIVVLENGKYSVRPLNDHPSLTDIMKTITAQHKIGEHPLFYSSGKIKEEYLGTDKTINESDDFNLHRALHELQGIVKKLNRNPEIDEDTYQKALDNITGVCKILGFEPSEEIMEDVINEDNIKEMTSKLEYLVDSLDAALKYQKENEGNPQAEKYKPFEFDSENSIRGTVSNFLTPITEVMDDIVSNVVYDDGKLYQAFVTPSYMTLTMQKFKWEGKRFENFITEAYGQSEWFKFKKNSYGRFYNAYNGWRVPWLRSLMRSTDSRKIFDHKVELNFNKKRYMRTMSDAEYTVSLLSHYWSEPHQKKDANVPAWFRVPMQSNKPSSEFIRFWSYRGSDYKNTIVDGMYDIFLQELSRIQTVNMRNLPENHPDFIENWDTNGRKFCYLPFLNSYLGASEKIGNLLKKEKDNEELAAILRKIETMGEVPKENQSRLSELVKEAIWNHMDEKTSEILENWESNGIIDEAKKIKGLDPVIDIKEQLENFIWNDKFAAMNILQITLGDIAEYKNAEDLQKRLAQLHAPGIRANIEARDYNGERVSDGTYRTIILKDWKKFQSNIIENLEVIFQKRIDAAKTKEDKAALEALKEELTRKPGTRSKDDKGGAYYQINVADAQGYSSPSSYRKKAFMFGKWSHKAEDVYNKLKKGDYNIPDLETAFQPLKPFVYAQLHKDVSAGNSPIKTMNMAFQAKNSEYLLVMADALLSGEDTGKPNLLRAIYRVMEESERLNPTKGIDTVQFESAIKSGKQGVIDIHQFANDANGEELAYDYIMKQIYTDETDADGNSLHNYNTRTFVHESDYSTYCLQQEVPEHFKNHQQAHGSQERMIIPSDLEFFNNPEKAEKFRREYEETIAANIDIGVENVIQKFKLRGTRVEKNVALSKILQDEILDSPRYGIDLFQACQVDKTTGDFRIPKGDPIHAKRIEQLINSIIKNDINKQEIAGGPIVQVSNFGTSKQLHIRFKDKSKEGAIIPLKEEYNPAEHDGKSYEQYCEENQGGIAYFEVFAPIWDDRLVEYYGNPDGSINIKAIEETDPELLKMISYRIPTEDKYSIAPMKIVGFMPRWAGEAIMLPYELTTIDGSDFDVDKRYVMRKDLKIIKNQKRDLETALRDKASKSLKKFEKSSPEKYKEFKAKHFPNKTLNNFIKDEVKQFLDNPQAMRHSSSLMESLYKEYQRMAYTTEDPTDQRTINNNKILDMTWEALTEELTADKILNPGGFEDWKKEAYKITAYKKEGQTNTWEQLEGKEIDELKDLCWTDKDLTWVDTQVQFYKQNAAASSMIGVFAVNKVAHAVLESNPILLDVEEICGPVAIKIGEYNKDEGKYTTELKGRVYVDKRYDNEGNLIGKTLGSGVCASADAVKDPILNLMNINMTTAGMFNTMIRLGIPLKDAALFMSQNIISEVLDEFNRANLSGFESLQNIISKKLSELRKKDTVSNNSTISEEGLSREEMQEGLTSTEHPEIDYKVLLMFQRMQTLTSAMRKLTFATRFNSISSAVGPLIIDNIILKHTMEQFDSSVLDDPTGFYTPEGEEVDINTIFELHPILKSFAKAVNVADLMFADMPAGSREFQNLLNALSAHGVVYDRMFSSSNKDLLSKLSDFYQSFLLVNSGFIKDSQIKEIDTFPKEFAKKDKSGRHIIKNKYPDNAFIQAIQMTTSRKTGRAFLSINITRLGEQEKEVLRSAWADLHRKDPELSMKLFVYSFFRGGIGFSPKSFMALVPNYIKERLETTLPNGEKLKYTDIYRVFDKGRARTGRESKSFNPEIVIDQFIRNNWNESRLVPRKGGKGTSYNTNLKTGELRVTKASDMADLENIVWMKTKTNNQTYLWKLKSVTADELVYTMVKPLGDNNEFVEISDKMITKPFVETTSDMDTFEEESSDVEAKGPSEITQDETPTDLVDDSQKAKRVAEMVDIIMEYNNRNPEKYQISKEQAQKKYENMKGNPEAFENQLFNMFKYKGLDVDRKDVIKKFKEFC